MRISDWSSDVCSSDLTPAGFAPRALKRRGFPTPPSTRSGHELRGEGDIPDPSGRGDAGRSPRRLPAPCRLQSLDGAGEEIGRASCRGRGGQYGEVSVGAVSLKKKRRQEDRRRK